MRCFPPHTQCSGVRPSTYPRLVGLCGGRTLGLLRCRHAILHLELELETGFAALLLEAFALLAELHTPGHIISKERRSGVRSGNGEITQDNEQKIHVLFDDLCCFDIIAKDSWV